MNTAKYRYPAAKLAAARGLLTAPHPQGEAESFSRAFLECDLGLRDMPVDDLDDSARSWVQTIKQTMDTSSHDDANGRDKWFVKAEQLSSEEKHSYSSAVDELAEWFQEKFTGNLN